MSEERKMILQMVSEGKITPEEAEKLLQAIDETERTAQSAAAEEVRRSSTAAGGPSTSGKQFVVDLGAAIERGVSESLRALDEAMRSLEISLDRRLNEQSRRDFRHKIEHKMRRAAERAVERAQDAQERAERAAQRAAHRAAEHADRAARHMEERLTRRADWQGSQFIKTGVAIDRETVEQKEQLSVPAEHGDRLGIENRVGDVAVTFYDGAVIEVEVKKTVWGENKADAEARAAATKVQLVRRGANVDLEVIRPHIVGVGVLIAKDTRIDYDIRVPHGTGLEVRNKVGDLRVAVGGQVPNLRLDTQVGNIDIAVPQMTGFKYDLASRFGSVSIATGDAADGIGPAIRGKIGDGAGNIVATVKTGDIQVHH